MTARSVKSVKSVKGPILSFAGRYFALLVLMAFLLVPALWLLLSSLRPNSELFGTTPNLSLRGLTFDNYIWAWSKQGLNMRQLLGNTFAINVMSAVLTTVFACFAGYGLVRYRGVGARLAVVFLLISQMIQGPMIMVPWYKIASTLNLLDTREVLVLIYQTMTIPAAVWLMASFFKAVPIELEEAAALDGASRIRTMFSIVLPLALPGIAAVGLYSFILGWNDYQYALILTSSQYSKTLQIGIAQVMESMGGTNWGGIMAAGVVAIIPAVVMFSLVQKTLIQGLAAGAVKG